MNHLKQKPSDYYRLFNQKESFDPYLVRLVQVVARPLCVSFFIALSGIVDLSFSHSAFGADPNAGGSGSDDGSKVYQPQEDDFKTTPYTGYGEFDEDKEENETLKFFQYGRFFGASLGLGAESVTGNRGLLWQGGFPYMNVKLHCWLDFQAALELGIAIVSHDYESKTLGGGTTVSVTNLGLGFRYYFDTRDLSAVLTFAHPHLLLGAGSYSKSEFTQATGATDTDNAFGFQMGGGLEFPITTKSLYFTMTSTYQYVFYKDRKNTSFAQQDKIADLTGGFITFVGGLMFTW